MSPSLQQRNRERNRFRPQHGLWFVKQSGGHIKIYSEVDHGTTVKIYLPPRRRLGSNETQPEITAPEATHGGELILVVEDNEGMRNVP